MYKVIIPNNRPDQLCAFFLIFLFFIFIYLFFLVSSVFPRTYEKSSSTSHKNDPSCYATLLLANSLGPIAVVKTTTQRSNNPIIPNNITRNDMT